MQTWDWKMTWPQGSNWYCPAGFGDGFGHISLGSENEARVAFWNTLQYEILSALQEDFAKGWEPVTQIGPSSFILRKFTKTNIGASAFIIWTFTLGFGLLLDILSGFAKYKQDCYELVAFRVNLIKRD